MTSVPLSQEGIALLPWSSPARKPGLTVLTDEDREVLLASLAQSCGAMAYDDVMSDLARYAHPSLTPGARAALLAARRDCAVQAAGLRGALADYRGEMPGLCDREALELAIEALDDRAREAMHELVHGNGGAR